MLLSTWICEFILSCSQVQDFQQPFEKFIIRLLKIFQLLRRYESSTLNFLQYKFESSYVDKMQCKI